MLNAEILLTIKLNQTLFADPKRIELLKQIKQCGSISQGAKLAGISYKSAWDHLDAMNNISPKPLLERNVGGKKGGGTQLTNYAERLLQLYELLTQLQEKAFSILHEEDQPLDSLLVATAHSSLQSSARNQLFGTVKNIMENNGTALVEMQISGLNQPLVASITSKSRERLRLHLGKEVMAMVKAPWLILNQTEHDQNVFKGTITKRDQNELFIQVDDFEFCANAQNAPENNDIAFYIDPKQVILATLY